MWLFRVSRTPKIAEMVVLNNVCYMKTMISCSTRCILYVYIRILAEQLTKSQ